MPRTSIRFLTFLILLALAPASQALGQCMLANPSFEMAGSGGPTFAGWNQFGSVGSSSTAAHGAVAARVSGPDLGGWDVSGYWQQMDTAPGARWSASVYVRHTSTRPLTGQCRAILNIEWRNAGGGLISYESYTAADASTPTGFFRIFTVQSQAAPAGTASARLLLGVLQSPTDPSPDVYYDQATFDYLGPPTLDDLQWTDFPGGRTLSFSGRSWRVKGPGYYGPGPSLYSDSPACVWVDGSNRLHLTIQRISGSWYSTEVALQQALGYGDYVFTTVGRLDNWDSNVVLGLFIWQYGACYDPAYGWWNPYNEFDVEFSRWGNPANDVGQFVAQPYDYPGNISRFNATFSDGELTSHAFRWLPDRVECRSWRGGPSNESPSTLIHSWTYRGPHIPRPEQPRVHLNLWQFNGPPTRNHEVIFSAFTFVPACVSPPCITGAPETPPPPGPAAGLSVAWPNPFSLRTAIRYEIRDPGQAEITIHDLSGHLVRVLVRSFVPAGEHQVAWDGRDDAGNRVASGVYLYRLRTGRAIETRRMVLLK